MGMRMKIQGISCLDGEISSTYKAIFLGNVLDFYSTEGESIQCYVIDLLGCTTDVGLFYNPTVTFWNSSMELRGFFRLKENTQFQRVCLTLVMI